MEEFFLGLLFTGDKLHVINNQDVSGAVAAGNGSF